MLNKINDFSQLGNLIDQAEKPVPVKEAQPEPHRPTKRANKKKLEQARQRPTSKQAEKPQTHAIPSKSLSATFQLKRTVNVYCWNVKATISRSAKRDDLMPVLKRALENEGTYAQDIAGHLLGEEVGREVVGHRLLEMCTGLGLLEIQGEKKRPRYFLSEDGQKALDAGRVMVPEEGTWTIWASDDQLLEYPILRVKPCRESSAYDEVMGDKKQDTKKRSDNFETIPKWLEASVHKLSQPSATGNELIRLDSIEPRIERTDHEAQLEITWSPEARNLLLKGKIADSKVNATPTAPAVSFEEVWRELLEDAHLWSSWDRDKSRLLVSFSETKGQEREPMQRRLEFVTPRLSMFGSFDATSRLISIFPASQADAQYWAEWILQNKINTYATEPDYSAWCEQATLPLNEYSDVLNLPTRSELASQIWMGRHNQKNTSKTWHIMAVEDWGI
ncbi:hypothetical protein [Marinobacterium marinum]|uniref:Uncharacterized protein n=1 Tax=Marinobacterium marinum TaxID=2756129 RepID=A0A7W2ADM4_9GAMM|nr:hypothetical protein [Marinobacterium marinum]MBA4503712.1 hypothetical protein [Marinobacterium marinum]